MNPAQQSYLDYLAQARKDQWRKITRYREYAAGEHRVQLTNRQKILLVGASDRDPSLPAWDPEFVLNICETILSVEVDRLRVKGITATVEDGDEQDSGAKESDRLTKLLWRWWKRNRMDANAPSCMYAAARDGDAYGVLEYDPERGPGVAIHRAYDGESGVEMAYEDDDAARPLYAVKRWDVKRPTKNNARTERRRRMNIYYPDRIEKYISHIGKGDYGWQPLSATDQEFNAKTDERVMLTDEYGNEYDATVSWWTTTGTRDGEPLGLAVIHLPHDPRGEAFGVSTIADVVPGLQDAINMAALALQAATVFNGYKEVILTGVELPPDIADDPDKARKLFYRYPASIHVFEDADASATQLMESDLRQLIEVKDSLIKDAATLTATPLSYFNLTGQISAEGTQQQLESALLAKTTRNQTVFGNAWEDMARMWLRLEAVYGDELAAYKNDLTALDDVELSCEWHPAETRNEREVIELAVQKMEKLGVPRKVVWREIGYTQDEIEAMEDTTQTLQNAAMGKLAALIQERENEASALDQVRGNGQAAGQDVVVQEVREGSDGKPGELPQNMESDKGLNGAQIHAALEILEGVRIGNTPPVVAIELLIALGVDRERATRMVNETARKKGRAGDGEEMTDESPRVTGSNGNAAIA